MSQRFQIEDLVVQDTSGVVFRALDTETGNQVSLRRFFPFGPKGGGLDAEEQIAYNIAVERLSAVTHPALRSVVSGGCDPIDGMPFIATEWIEGTRLQSFIDRGPLTPEEATGLLTQALEVCQLLSEVLAEEAVWVETDLRAIVVGAEGTGRGITFWIAPLKWLGRNDGQRDLGAIINLTEDILGWRGKTVSDQAGRGLGGWLKWLRGASRTTSLHEAREMLAASVGVEPPPPAKHLVRQATRPVIPGKKKKKPSNILLVVTACAALVATGLGGLVLVRRNADALEKTSASALPGSEIADARTPPSPAAAPGKVEVEPPAVPEQPVFSSSRGEKSIEEVNRNAAEMTAAARRSATEKESKAADVKTGISKSGGIFTPEDHDLLVGLDDQIVTVEGTLEGIGYSTSRKTMYLQFSKKPATADTRGSIRTKDIPENLTESKLAPLVGKKVRIKGKVQLEKIINRPVIVIESRSAIEPAE